ncbi:spore coat protein YlbD [Halobacillus sp. Marseille-Q1614]|uniref:spore coat protein YlbD n=1 Tax=Halobacillus sp. Marseille-Q1614 TaxID=2709134 RepID=UPI00156FC06E|nr:spore coat protein YlbD [Halobacillus sp. Marseille-Q1614]
MSEHILHPSVQKFKQFVDQNPKVKEQIRKDHTLMQKYYEQWMILGEDDSFWETGEAEESRSLQKEEGSSLSKKEWMKQFGELMKEINWEDVSKHIDELNGAIDQIQQLITNMQRQNQKQNYDRSHPMNYPYY